MNIHNYDELWISIIEIWISIGTARYSYLARVGPVIYDNLLADVFHHSEPFVKMLYEPIFHTCHQTKLNNISK